MYDIDEQIKKANNLFEGKIVSYDSDNMINGSGEAAKEGITEIRIKCTDTGEEVKIGSYEYVNEE